LKEYSMTDRESVKVLQECIDLQLKKSRDYQNPNSSIKQADYYPNGCMTLLDTIQAKVLRMRSVMEAMQNDPTYKPNFESLEDSAKDLINYASFFVAYSRGKVDGQKADRDFVNRKIDTTKNVNPVLYDSMDNYGGALGFIGETGSSGRVGVVGSTAHWGNAFGANGGTER
jgi:hypothetical protein